MVKPFPTGARYETSVGPRCRNHLASSRFGAVAENPKTSESLPACSVTSIPQREPSDATFRKYKAVIFKFTSLTRNVVPRLRNKRLAGSLKSCRYPASAKPPYCQVVDDDAVGDVSPGCSAACACNPGSTLIVKRVVSMIIRARRILRNFDASRVRTTSPNGSMARAYQRGFQLVHLTS